jgi:hypothetical protein
VIETRNQSRFVEELLVVGFRMGCTMEKLDRHLAPELPILGASYGAERTLTQEAAHDVSVGHDGPGCDGGRVVAH